MSGVKPSAAHNAPLAGGESLLLSLDQIHAYERDPRHSPNAEYERIKASIRETGMDQPLVVTQRPGAPDYLVAAGGNTRLRILKELYEEIPNRELQRVHCIYRLWRGEADVLLAHLRENDLRGALTFIDRARAVRDYRELLANERGAQAPTQRELTEQLRQRGYALSQATVSHMEYAVDVLFALIPKALAAGLERRAIENIRSLERALRRLWERRMPEAVDEFNDFFNTLCRRFDSPDWDLQSLRHALEAELAERLNRSVQAVRLMLEAELTGAPGEDFDIPESEPWPNDEPDDAEDSDSNDDSGVTSRRNPTIPKQGEAQIVSALTGGASVQSTPETPEALVSEGSTTIAPAKPAILAVQSPEKPTIELPALRVEAYRLAVQLAERHGLHDLVTPLVDDGCGFLVQDVPNAAFLAQLDEEELGTVSMLWWQLVACAELTVAPLPSLLPHLNPSSLVYQALDTQDPKELFRGVWTLDPGQVGYRLWRTLGADDWSDLLALMTCYRSLHHAAGAAQRPLWKGAA